MSDIQEEQKRLYKRAEENDIKLLQDKCNKQKEVLDKIKDKLKENRVYISGERHLAFEIEELLEEIE
jgi:hypothetical protein